VLTFDKDNRIVDRLTYSVESNAEGGYSFSILDEARNALSVSALVGRS
jgi:aspartate 1-decarboxylase